LKTNNNIDDLLVGINLANYEALDKILVKTKHLVSLRSEILGLRAYIADQKKEVTRLKVEKNDLISKQINLPRYNDLDSLVSKGKLYDKKGA